jgi:hypothetical protein
MGSLLNNPEALVEFLKSREIEIRILLDQCSPSSKPHYEGRLFEIQNLLSLIKTGRGKAPQ